MPTWMLHLLVQSILPDLIRCRCSINVFPTKSLPLGANNAQTTCTANKVYGK